MARNLHHMSWSWCVLTFPTPLIRVPDWERTNEISNLCSELWICFVRNRFDGADYATTAAIHASEPQHSGYPRRRWRPKQGWNSCAADYDRSCNHGRGSRGRKFQYGADPNCARCYRRGERHDLLRPAKPDSERPEQGADAYGRQPTGERVWRYRGTGGHCGHQQREDHSNTDRPVLYRQQETG